MRRVLGFCLIVLLLLAGGYLAATRLRHDDPAPTGTRAQGSTVIRTAIRPEP